MPGAVLGWPVRPTPSTRFPSALSLLSPSFSRALGPRGWGAPSGPHESGAAAGGLPVSALTALRVRKSDGNASSGGLRGLPRVAALVLGWCPARLPRRGGVPSLFNTKACEPPPLAGGATLWFARPIRLRPQIRRDNPLNLSILLSGGKETNQDSLSSGERRGKSPAPNPRPTGGRGKCGVWKTACPVSLGGLSPSDRGSARGRCEAGNGPRRAGVRSSRSRVVWECSPKWVVNSI